MNKNTETEETPIVEVMKDEENKYPWFMPGGIIDFKLLGEEVMRLYENEGSRIHTISDTDEMYIYWNGVYSDRAYKLINLRIQEILGGYTNEYKKKQIVEYIKTKTQIRRSYFNPMGYEIPILNGIYNVMTDVRRDATPDDLFTYQFQIFYDPTAECPNINKFFNRILPETDKVIVQEEIAYCFVPGYPIQTMFWWIGGGGNGKGTVFRIMERMLLKDNMTFSGLHELATNEDYCRAELFGKRANVCGDIDKKDLRKTDYIKKLTGGDTILVRKINKEPFKMVNEAKIFFAMNDDPDVDDDSDGFWRRPIPTQYNARLTAQEMSDYNEEVLHSEEEISGFFNLLMIHVKSVINNKSFTGAPSMEDVRDSLNETESVELFLKTEVLMEIVGQKYKKDTMYEDYVKFSESKDMAPRLYNSFFKYLKNEKKMEAKQRPDPVDGKKKRYFIDCFKVPRNL